LWISFVIDRVDVDFVFRMEIEESPRVKTAATLFQRLCYNYRDQLTAGIICAGWDRKNGAQVVQPYSHAYLTSLILQPYDFMMELKCVCYY